MGKYTDRKRRCNIPVERYVCKEGEHIYVDSEGVWIVRPRGGEM